MRMIVSAMAFVVATPALADQSSFPIDYATCLNAIKTAAHELKLPLAFAVLNPNLAVFNIATTGGTVSMICNRAAGTLTVSTPRGTSILPYVSGAGNDE